MDYLSRVSFFNHISEFSTNLKEIFIPNQNKIDDEKVLKKFTPNSNIHYSNNIINRKVNTPRGEGLLIDSKDGIMKI